MEGGQRGGTEMWSRASLVGCFVWLALALLLDVRAGLDAWVHRTVSDLVREEPVLVPLSLLANAVAVYSLGMALRRASGACKWAGSLLVAAAVMTAVAALVPTDGGRIETWSGWTHALAAGGTFIALNVAFWRANLGMDGALVSRRHRRAAAGLAAFASLSLAHLGVVLAVRQVTGNGWTDMLGVWERLLIAANMAWVGLAAWHGARPRL